MDCQVAEDVKSERLGEILNLQEVITYSKNRLLEGSTQEVLIEGPSETDDRMLAGRTRSNKIVTISNNGESAGSYALVRIERARQHSLFGVNVRLEGVSAAS
jgi:tRNA-2-methylthio-N6-dimethylallyladenosine synthase